MQRVFFKRFQKFGADNGLLGIGNKRPLQFVIVSQFTAENIFN